jgi:hypothetical protein
MRSIKEEIFTECIIESFIHLPNQRQKFMYREEDGCPTCASIHPFSIWAVEYKGCSIYIELLYMVGIVK